MTYATINQGQYTVSGDGKIVNALPYYIEVGRALTVWAIVESMLSEYYCMLVCGDSTPADGAITSFYTLRSFDERRNIIMKCLDQVLYPNEFNDFRKTQKASLNRLQKLSTLRNKIAHGAVLQYQESESFSFYPYFLDAVGIRERGLKKMHGTYPSTVKKIEKWDLAELKKNVRTLEGAITIATDLIPALSGQYEEHSELLKGTTRMFLRPGLPFPGFPKDQN